MRTPDPFVAPADLERNPLFTDCPARPRRAILPAGANVNGRNVG